MTPTHTRRGNRLYRYYVSQSVIKRGADGGEVSRVPAAEIEAAVVDQLRGMLRSPEVIVGMVKAVARGFRWRKLLETGVYGTVAEIAAAEKINPS